MKSRIVFWSILTSVIFGCFSIPYISQAHIQKPLNVLKASGGKYKIQIKSEHIRMADFAESTQWWGTSGHANPMVVTSVELTHNNKRFMLPRSAFIDLGLVNSLRVVPTRGGCKIIIGGSDASNAYEAVLKIRDEEIVERYVHPTEYPEGNWEKTIYKNVPVDYTEARRLSE